MLTGKYRNAAIDWLNGKQDFQEGIEILKKAGFKPGVVKRLEMIGKSDNAQMHLKQNINLYLDFIGREVEDTDAEMGVIKGKQVEELVQDDKKGLSIDDMADKLEKQEAQAPENAKKLIIMYAKFYRKREKAHREMQEVQETNSEENIEARRKCSEIIDSCTTMLEKIYPLVQSYLEQKKVPSDEELSAVAEEPEKKDEEKDETDEDDLDTLTKEELQKRLKSAKTKILRKKNLLEFQQETKGDTPNPLPDCPKRVKYETEIAKLEKEVEALQYAIARKG